jgi:hypothetical protein
VRWLPLPGGQPEAAAAAPAAVQQPLAPLDDGAHRRRRRLPRLRLRRRRPRTAAALLDGAAAPDALPHALKACSGCGVSLLLRAARDIPLSQLREEYEKILKRRLARVGGDPSDPALGQLLDSFSDPARLPPGAVAGGGPGGRPPAVRRGASIVFTRDGDAVHARVGCVPREGGGRARRSIARAHGGSHRAGRASGGLPSRRAHSLPRPCSPLPRHLNCRHHHLGSVTSCHLGEALLDLYLGPQPVSASAKAGAADTLARILAAGGRSGGGGGRGGERVFYEPRASERLRCSGAPGDARACVVEL